MQSKSVKNVMNVDLEEWFDINLAKDIDKDTAENRVDINVERLLALFDKNDIKATFFVVGRIVEQYPELIRKIVEAGHEIGCHSYAHKLIYSQTPEEFRQDVVTAKKKLEAVIDGEVISYRAPSWSITKETFWALEILEEVGFKIDSSIFPFENFLYGVKDAPTSFYNTSRYNDKSNLIECPPSVLKIGKISIPFAGGTYFRILPYFFVKKCIKHINGRGNAAVMYIHPWEIDSQTPRIKMCLRDRLITYWGIRNNYRKLEKLLSEFEFDSMRNVVKYLDK